MIEHVFEDVVRPYGSVWKPGRGIDEYDDQYTGVLLDFVKRTITGQKRVYGPKGPIFCGFVLSHKFNAFATTSHGYELIALFSGAISHMVAGHHSLLSDPKSLPTIGEANNERLSPDALELFRQCLPLQKLHHHPKDERFEVATCLAWLSSVFIALHEVGHVVRCHPAYLKRKYGMSVYEEFPMSNSGNPYIDVSIALEWEADEYAAITSYQLTHHLLQSGSFRALRPLGADFAWGVATSMIFLAMARLSKSWTAGSISHPPAFVRYVWSMLSIEGAPECSDFKPNGESLRAGFSEVATWFKRNDLAIDGEKKEMSAADQMEYLQDQYSQVRAVFAAESSLWKELNQHRTEQAQEWLTNQSL